MRTTLSLLILSIAIALVACTSPLDVNTTRTETPLTAAPRVEPSYVQQSFTSGELQYALVGTPSIKVDTSGPTMSFWINITMAESNPAADTLIKGFTIQVDSVVANGYTTRLQTGQGTIRMDLGYGPEDFRIDGSVNTATLLIEELPAAAGMPRTAEITILIEGNKGQFVSGFGEQLLLGRLRVVM